MCGRSSDSISVADRGSCECVCVCVCVCVRAGVHAVVCMFGGDRAEFYIHF